MLIYYPETGKKYTNILVPRGAIGCAIPELIPAPIYAVRFVDISRGLRFAPTFAYTEQRILPLMQVGDKGVNI